MPRLQRMPRIPLALRRAPRVPRPSTLRRPVLPDVPVSPATGDTGPRGTGSRDTEPTDGRPGSPDGTAAPETAPGFDLAYVRQGPRGRTPVVVVPGGPGLASVLPYLDFRRRAARRGLDVLMMEHRGVGFSRRDPDGTDLPLEAMRVAYVVDDLAAILRHEETGPAVIVGSSYGTYVALALAATHPDLVAALVLDSTTLSTDDDRKAREHARDLFWRGREGDDETRELAARIRRLAIVGRIEPNELGLAARILYEYGGPPRLREFLDQLERGGARWARSLLSLAGSGDSAPTVPYVMEFDLVGEIAVRELAYEEGDGSMFDQSAGLEGLRDRFSDFVGEPFDLEAALPEMHMPVLVLSGDRDMVTPRPIARRVADLAPHGRLVTLREHGHSALDSHSGALLEAMVAVADGRPDDVDTDLLDSVRRRRGASGLVDASFAAALGVERRLPGRLGSGRLGNGRLGNGRLGNGRGD